ncbi:hypothetical protein [Caldivirga maquilingensis]|uniref:Uncharacterized protein n=1 Tax=Caldivirga maquilingensis (strain ATCC 700844 / DSM 13496 / JCM 10307 / IC-167) TaxID=397948 RepID=A8MBD1_CALMQ|nr:hypothetical protein [Caldivirga maquilingensis]ABW01221.1 hypothetical protein Cmaq_0375 [Caldivirga maquilingensis IC-167]
MKECQLDRCISQVSTPTQASFRSTLECLLKNTAERVIIIDNGQQFTWVAYVEVNEPGKLKELSSYLQDCLSRIKDTPLSSFTSGLRVLSMENQDLFIFNKELVAIKVFLAS